MLLDLLELFACVAIIVIAIVEVLAWHYIRVEFKKEAQGAVEDLVEIISDITDEYELKDITIQKKEEES